MVLATATLLAFTACGTPSTPGTGNGGGSIMPGAKPTAQNILKKAQDARVSDVTFTMKAEVTSEGKTMKITNEGKATTNPARMALTMTMESDGQIGVVMEAVVDEATKTTYTRFTAPAMLAKKQWTKSTDTPDELYISSAHVVPEYGKLTNVSLVGEEQVNGVSVWHIKATIPAEGSNPTADVELYLRQSDSLPAQMIIQDPTVASGAVTVTYKEYNTGIKIDLPNA